MSGISPVTGIDLSTDNSTDAQESTQQPQARVTAVASKAFTGRNSRTPPGSPVANQIISQKTPDSGASVDSLGIDFNGGFNGLSMDSPSEERPSCIPSKREEAPANMTLAAEKPHATANSAQVQYTFPKFEDKLPSSYLSQNSSSSSSSHSAHSQVKKTEKHQQFKVGLNLEQKKEQRAQKNQQIRQAKRDETFLQRRQQKPIDSAALTDDDDNG